MIWYLIICGLSECSISPAFINQQQCEFVQANVLELDNRLRTRCIGVSTPRYY